MLFFSFLFFLPLVTRYTNFGIILLFFLFSLFFLRSIYLSLYVFKHPSSPSAVSKLNLEEEKKEKQKKKEKERKRREKERRKYQYRYKRKSLEKTARCSGRHRFSLARPIKRLNSKEMQEKCLYVSKIIIVLVRNVSTIRNNNYRTFFCSPAFLFRAQGRRRKRKEE